jgi:hypothetical protein
MSFIWPDEEYIEANGSAIDLPNLSIFKIWKSVNILHSINLIYDL